MLETVSNGGTSALVERRLGNTVPVAAGRS